MDGWRFKMNFSKLAKRIEIKIVKGHAEKLARWKDEWEERVDRREEDR